MSTEIAPVVAKLTSDTTAFERGFDAASQKTTQLERQIQETEAAVRSLGAGGVEALGETAEHVGLLHDALEGATEALGEMAGGFAVASLAASAIEKIAETIKEFVGELVKAGAEAETIQLQFRQTFVGGAAEAQEWAEKTSAAVGLSTDDMLKAATKMKVMTDGLGVATGESEKMSTALAGMAANMALAKNIPLDQAVQALSAGLHGAGRGLYEFGIAINTTTQNQEAMRLGLGDTYAKLTAAEQVQVNFNLSMKGAAVNAVNAAEALNTYNGQMASLKSHLEEAFGKIGGDGTGMLTAVVKLVNELVDGFNHLKESTRGWIEELAMNVAIGPIAQVFNAIKDAIREVYDLMGKAPPSWLSGAGGGGKDDGIHADVTRALAQQAQDDAAGSTKKQADENRRREAQQKLLEEQAKAFADLEKSEKARHALALDAIKEMQKEDSQRTAAAVFSAQEDFKGAFAAAEVRRKSAQDAERRADDEVKRAQKQLDAAKGAGGSGGEIRAAQAALDAAYDHVQKAAADVISADQRELGSISSAIKDQQALQEGRDKSSQVYMEAQKKIDDLQAARQAKEEQLHNDQLDLEEKRRENIERMRAAAREASDYFKALGAGLGRAALGNASGIVDGAAAGGRAAGPVGAAAGAAVGLLEQSDQFKKLQAELNKLTQALANTIGAAIEPLLPVIDEITKAIQPVLDALKPLLRALGQSVANALTMALKELEPFIGPLTSMIQSITPLIEIFEKVNAVVMEVAAFFDPMTYAMKALAAAAGPLATAVQYAADGLGAAWDAILSAIQYVLNALAHALPGDIGDAFRSLDDSLQGMKYGAQKSADAAQAVIDALDGGARSLTDAQRKTAEAIIASDRKLAASLAQLGPAMAAAAESVQLEADRLQKELDATAPFGSALDMAIRHLNLLERQAKDAADAIASMSSAADQVSSGASKKVGDDSNRISTIQQAIALAQQQGLGADVVNELKTELAQAQAQYAIDQLQLQVAIDAQTLAHDDAQSQLDELAEQTALAKVQADYARGLKDSDPQVIADWTAAMDASRKHNADGATAEADAKSLQEDQQQLLIAQAQQLVENTKATAGNTKAVQEASGSNLNVPAMFKVAQAVDALTTSSSGSGGRSGKGIGAAIDSRIQNVLQAGTYSELTINGDIHISTTGSGQLTPDQLAAMLKREKQKRKGSSSRDDGPRWHFKDQG